jgi:hypothetical protein
MKRERQKRKNLALSDAVGETIRSEDFKSGEKKLFFLSHK